MKANTLLEGGIPAIVEAVFTIKGRGVIVCADITTSPVPVIHVGGQIKKGEEVFQIVGIPMYDPLDVKRRESQVDLLVAVQSGIFNAGDEILIFPAALSPPR